jgi:hypothetical protein
MNIKMDHIVTGVKVWIGLNKLCIQPNGSICEHGDEPLDSIEEWNVLTS